MASRLATAQSAYLRSAVHQPVDWYPWCPEAFEAAQRTGRPILLDIGAAWCHWCHVMDRESYEDPRIADQLNRDWICIKVDRDERPDVDARYQRAVQALTGQGGWPLTAFLTPEGQVFYGGTYFPPDGKYGRPGFSSVLRELIRIYREEPGRVAGQAARLRQAFEEQAREARAGPLEAKLLDDAVELMARMFDFRNGGFGTQPKFPHPAALDLLLARWFDTGQPWLREMVDRTLTAMARGGIHDHLGGGFHRYAVDARWVVPHFEKMSYDNSELLRAYLHAALAPGSPSGAGSPGPPGGYRAVIEGIAGWVMEVLALPEGGYGASQDADAGPDDDGDYFTWTAEEARAVLSDDEFAVVARHYDIQETGEMHHNPRKNVLWIAQDAQEIAAALSWPVWRVAALLESGRQKLRAARARRAAPAVDRTVYTGWNAMLASALIEAAPYLSRPDLERHALRTLERLFREGSTDQGASGVRHALGGPDLRLLEDQVQLALAALEAHEATGDARWRRRAEALGEYVWAAFAAQGGGLDDRPGGASGEGFLEQPWQPIEDAPAPSGNGAAALLAARLAEHTGEPRWRERLERLLGAFAGSLAGLSLHAATLLQAADWYLRPATHVAIIGEPGDPAADALFTAARSSYRPRTVMHRLGPQDSARALPGPLKAMLEGKTPRAYVCAGEACAAPTADPSELAATLARFGRTAP